MQSRRGAAGIATRHVKVGVDDGSSPRLSDAGWFQVHDRLSVRNITGQPSVSTARPPFATAFCARNLLAPIALRERDTNALSSAARPTAVCFHLPRQA